LRILQSLRIGFLLVMCGPIGAVESSRESCVVRIQVASEGSEEHGTGFVVAMRGERAYVMTAYHVVRTAKLAKVFLFGDNTEYTGTVVRVQKSIDVALLEVNLPESGRRNVRVLMLDMDHAVRKGDAVTTIGHPAAGGDWTELSGRVANRKGSELVLDLIASGGSSGSPVLLDGRAVAMVIEKSNDTRLTYAQPAGVLREFLRGSSIAAITHCNSLDSPLDQCLFRESR
jgi:Trypsin-like peptidase domain